MSRRAITTLCAISTALFLLLIGIVHGVVNVSGLQRTIERGEISPRLGDSVLANAAFSGSGYNPYEFCSAVDLRLQYPAIFGYAFVFPFVCLLLAILFARSEKSGN